MLSQKLNNVSDNKIGARGAGSMGEMLKTNKTLTALTLRSIFTTNKKEGKKKLHLAFIIPKHHVMN